VTTIYNDPAEFAEDQLVGFLDLYSDRVRGVAGGVVALASGQPQVAVVVGGGSGHYPAFAGLVGPGLASGAVVGNVFTSPSAAQAYSVAKAAHQGKGVILTFGNYAGDVLNFGIAADRLRKEGIDTRIVTVTDDVASAAEFDSRRGIAGDFAVFKIMGAAAAAGESLDEVERIGRSANAATRTLGIAFSGCTMPGASSPLFSVPAGNLGLGLGIHGEPGIRDVAILSARDLAALFVDSLLAEAPANGGNTVGVILNGLGTTKYEELFVLWGEVAPLLRSAGLQLADVEVGELVTSLDMGGCSLTLTWLDDELEPLWRADAYTPAYRKHAAAVQDLRAVDAHDALSAVVVSAPKSTAAARAAGEIATRGISRAAAVLHEHEAELGDIDSIAGDGDHGRGMVRGIDAALAAARSAVESGGVGWVLRSAGQAWAEKAGGTSGVLWGAALEAAGAELGDDREVYDAAAVAAAASAFSAAIVDLGRATIGDKTMVDAMLPFVERLTAEIDDGTNPKIAWQRASQRATESAAATATLTPRLGRARPLAERSIGTPDAGATSLAMIVSGISQLWDESSRTEE
jgi:D-erythrulose 4-kinase